MTTIQFHIDPSLRDMSLADVNPAFNLATSQDCRHDADGNSIPGGEPVHRSAFFPQTFNNPDVVTFPAQSTLPEAIANQTDLRVN
jgi:hypothetical protein